MSLAGELTSLVAETTSDNTVKLSWTGTLSYVSVEQSINGTTYTTIATNITDLYYTISDLNTNTLYYFRVTPYSSSGTEGTALVCDVNVPITATITSFYAGTCSQTAIPLYWRGSFYAIQLQYKKSTDSDYTTISDKIYGRQYILSNLDEDTYYNIRIKPYYVNGELGDAYSTITVMTDYTPYLTDFSFSEISSKYVVVSWTGEANYIKFLQSSDGGASYTNISTINPEYDASGDITIIGLNSYTQYYFAAVPYNYSYGAGETTTITTKTKIGIDSFYVSEISQEYITLGWEREDYTFLEIYKSTDSGATYNYLTTLSDVETYTDTSVAADTDYYYYLLPYIDGATTETATVGVSSEVLHVLSDYYATVGGEITNITSYSLDVSFSAAASSFEYALIQLSTDGGASYVDVSYEYQNPAEVGSFTHTISTDISYNTYYTVRVLPYGRNQLGSNSFVSTVCTAGTIDAIYMSISATAVDLSWSGEFVSSVVERATDAAMTDVSYISVVGTTTYTDIFDTSFVSHYYRVRPVNAAGDIAAAALSPVFYNPSIQTLYYSDVSSSTATLSWSGQFSRVAVQTATAAEGTYSTVATTTGNTITFSTAAAAPKYARLVPIFNGVSLLSAGGDVSGQTTTFVYNATISTFSVAWISNTQIALTISGVAERMALYWGSTDTPTTAISEDISAAAHTTIYEPAGAAMRTTSYYFKLLARGRGLVAGAVVDTSGYTLTLRNPAISTFYLSNISKNTSSMNVKLNWAGAGYTKLAILYSTNNNTYSTLATITNTTTTTYSYTTDALGTTYYKIQPYSTFWGVSTEMVYIPYITDISVSSITYDPSDAMVLSVAGAYDTYNIKTSTDNITFVDFSTNVVARNVNITADDLTEGALQDVPYYFYAIPYATTGTAVGAKSSTVNNGVVDYLYISSVSQSNYFTLTWSGYYTTVDIQYSADNSTFTDLYTGISSSTTKSKTIYETTGTTSYYRLIPYTSTTECIASDVIYNPSVISSVDSVATSEIGISWTGTFDYIKLQYSKTTETGTYYDISKVIVSDVSSYTITTDDIASLDTDSTSYYVKLTPYATMTNRNGVVKTITGAYSISFVSNISSITLTDITTTGATLSWNGTFTRIDVEQSTDNSTFSTLSSDITDDYSLAITTSGYTTKYYRIVSYATSSGGVGMPTSSVYIPTIASFSISSVAQYEMTVDISTGSVFDIATLQYSTDNSTFIDLKRNITENTITIDNSVISTLDAKTKTYYFKLIPYTYGYADSVKDVVITGLTRGPDYNASVSSFYVENVADNSTNQLTVYYTGTYENATLKYKKTTDTTYTAVAIDVSNSGTETYTTISNLVSDTSYQFVMTPRNSNDLSGVDTTEVYKKTISLLNNLNPTYSEESSTATAIYFSWTYNGYSKLRIYNESSELIAVYSGGSSPTTYYLSSGTETLTSDTDYTYTIKVYDYLGNVETTTLTAYTTANSEIDITYTAETDGSITLDWPAEGYTLIQIYNYTLHGSSPPAANVVVYTITSETATYNSYTDGADTLSYNTKYVYLIKLTSSLGTTTNIYTSTYTMADISNYSVANIRPNTVDISWSGDFDYVVTQYSSTSSTLASGLVEVASDSTTGNTISSLVPNTYYYMRLCPVNLIEVSGTKTDIFTVNTKPTYPRLFWIYDKSYNFATIAADAGLYDTVRITVSTDASFSTYLSYVDLSCTFAPPPPPELAFDPSLVATTPPVLYHTITDLSTDVMYYFRATPYNITGAAGRTIDTSGQTLGLITELVVSDVAATYLTASWTGTYTHAYLEESVATDGSYVMAARTDASRVVLTERAKNTVFYYRVRPLNAMDESGDIVSDICACTLGTVEDLSLVAYDASNIYQFVWDGSFTKLWIYSLSGQINLMYSADTRTTATDISNMTVHGDNAVIFVPYNQFDISAAKTTVYLPYIYDVSAANYDSSSVMLSWMGSYSWVSIYIKTDDTEYSDYTYYTRTSAATYHARPLTSNKKYYFKMVPARAGLGEGFYVSDVSAYTWARVSSFVATPVDTSSVRLVWDGSFSSVQIWVSDVSGTYSGAATTFESSTRETVYGGLAAGNTTYYFKIVPTGTLGVYAAGGKYDVSATTYASITTFVAEPYDSSAVRLTWDGSFSSVQIWVSDVSGSYTAAATTYETTTRTTIFRGLAYGNTTYYFKIVPTGALGTNTTAAQYDISAITYARATKLTAATYDSSAVSLVWDGSFSSVRIYVSDVSGTYNSAVYKEYSAPTRSAIYGDLWYGNTNYYFKIVPSGALGTTTDPAAILSDVSAYTWPRATKFSAAALDSSAITLVWDGSFSSVDIWISDVSGSYTGTATTYITTTRSVIWTGLAYGNTQYYFKLVPSGTLGATTKDSGAFYVDVSDITYARIKSFVVDTYDSSAVRLTWDGSFSSVDVWVSDICGTYTGTATTYSSTTKTTIFRGLWYGNTQYFFKIVPNGTKGATTQDTGAFYVNVANYTYARTTKFIIENYDGSAVMLTWDGSFSLVYIYKSDVSGSYTENPTQYDTSVRSVVYNNLPYGNTTYYFRILPFGTLGITTQDRGAFYTDISGTTYARATKLTAAALDGSAVSLTWDGSFSSVKIYVSDVSGSYNAAVYKEYYATTRSATYDGLWYGNTKYYFKIVPAGALGTTTDPAAILSDVSAYTYPRATKLTAAALDGSAVSLTWDGSFSSVRVYATDVSGTYNTAVYKDFGGRAGVYDGLWYGNTKYFFKIVPNGVLTDLYTHPAAIVSDVSAYTYPRITSFVATQFDNSGTTLTWDGSFSSVRIYATDVSGTYNTAVYTDYTNTRTGVYAGLWYGNTNYYFRIVPNGILTDLYTHPAAIVSDVSAYTYPRATSLTAASFDSSGATLTWDGSFSSVRIYATDVSGTYGSVYKDYNTTTRTAVFGGLAYGNTNYYFRVVPMGVLTETKKNAIPVYISDTTYITFTSKSQTVSTGTNTYSYVNGTYEFNASSYYAAPAYGLGSNSVWHSGYGGEARDNDGNNLGYNQSPYNSSGVYQGGTSGSTSSNYWKTTIDGIDYTGEWFQIKLPYYLKLSDFSFYVGDTSIPERNPKILYIAGSTDGSTWMMIYSKTNGTSAQYTSDVVNTSNYYSYFRFVINQTSGNDVANYSNLSMSGYILYTHPTSIVSDVSAYTWARATRLTAAAFDSSAATLTWDGSFNSMFIYVSDISNTYTTAYGEYTTKSAFIQGLQYGNTTYYFRAIPAGVLGTTTAAIDPSAIISNITTLTYPTVSKFVAAALDSSAVWLTWDGSFSDVRLYSATDAGAYRVWDYKTVYYPTRTTLITDLSYANKKYYFKIVPNNATGDGIAILDASDITYPTISYFYTTDVGDIRATFAFDGCYNYLDISVNNTTNTTYTYVSGITTSGTDITGLDDNAYITATATAYNDAGYNVSRSYTFITNTSAFVNSFSASAVATSNTYSGVYLEWTSSNYYYMIVQYNSTSAVFGATDTFVQYDKPTLNATITDLSANTTYYFKITPYSQENSAGEPLTASVLTYGKMTTAKTTYYDTSAIRLDWSGNYESVNVYVSTAASSYPTTYTNYDKTTTSTVYSNLSAGTTYYFKFAAVNTQGEGLYRSDVSSITYPKVASFLAAPLDGSAITLTWDGSFATVSVWMSDISGSAAYTGTAATYTYPTRSAVWNGLIYGNTQYYFKITPLNEAGYGAVIYDVSAYTYPRATKLVASALDGSAVSLIWDGSFSSVRIYATDVCGNYNTLVYKDFTNTRAGLYDGLWYGNTKYFFRVVPNGYLRDLYTHPAAIVSDVSAYTYPRATKLTAAALDGSAVSLIWDGSFSSVRVYATDVCGNYSASYKDFTNTRAGVYDGLWYGNTKYFFRVVPNGYLRDLYTHPAAIVSDVSAYTYPRATKLTAAALDGSAVSLIWDGSFSSVRVYATDVCGNYSASYKDFTNTRAGVYDGLWYGNTKYFFRVVPNGYLRDLYTHPAAIVSDVSAYTYPRATKLTAATRDSSSATLTWDGSFSSVRIYVSDVSGTYNSAVYKDFDTTTRTATYDGLWYGNTNYFFKIVPNGYLRDLYTHPAAIVSDVSAYTWARATKLTATSSDCSAIALAWDGSYSSVMVYLGDASFQNLTNSSLYNGVSSGSSSAVLSAVASSTATYTGLSGWTISLTATDSITGGSAVVGYGTNTTYATSSSWAGYYWVALGMAYNGTNTRGSLSQSVYLAAGTYSFSFMSSAAAASNYSTFSTILYVDGVAAATQTYAANQTIYTTSVSFVVSSYKSVSIEIRVSNTAAITTDPARHVSIGNISLSRNYVSSISNYLASRTYTYPTRSTIWGGLEYGNTRYFFKVVPTGVLGTTTDTGAIITDVSAYTYARATKLTAAPYDSSAATIMWDGSFTAVRAFATDICGNYGTTYTEFTGATTRTGVVSGLKYGNTKYFFRVVPVGVAGVATDPAAFVSDVSAYTYARATKFVAAPNPYDSSSIALTWDGSFTSVRVYSTDISGTYPSTYTEYTATRTGTYTGLTYGNTKYFFKIVPVGVLGATTDTAAMISDVSAYTYPRITSFKRGTLATDAIQLTWDGSFTKVYVYKSTTENSFSTYTEVAAGTNYTTFSSLTTNTKYYFRITPVGYAGSGVSVDISQTTLGTVSSASATVYDNSSITLTWSGAFDSVLVDLSGFSTLTYPSTTTTTLYTGLRGNATYTFAITPRNVSKETGTAYRVSPTTYTKADLSDVMIVGAVFYDVIVDPSMDFVMATYTAKTSYAVYTDISYYGFTSPSVSTNSRTLNPSTAGWTITGHNGSNAYYYLANGISQSKYTLPSAYTQYASFVFYNTTMTMYQDITLATGTYTLSFYYSSWLSTPSYTYYQPDVTVSLGGTTIYTRSRTTVDTGAWILMTSSEFTISTAGTYTLLFSFTRDDTYWTITNITGIYLNKIISGYTSFVWSGVYQSVGLYTCDVSGTTSGTISNYITDSSYTYTATLSDNTTYYYKVVPTNMGQTSSTKYMIASTTTPATLTTAKISWYDNSAIRLVWDGSFETVNITVNSSTTTYPNTTKTAIYTDLTANTKYTYTIAAINAAGTTSVSTDVSATTLGYVSYAYASPLDASSMTVYITGTYSTAYITANNTTKTTSGTECIFDGLRGNATYTFKITPYNSADVSNTTYTTATSDYTYPDFSDVLVFVATKYDVMVDPSIHSFIASTWDTSSVYLTWAGVYQYVSIYQCDSAGTTIGAATDVSYATTTSTIITGLSVNKLYYFKIVATNNSRTASSYLMTPAYTAAKLNYVSAISYDVSSIMLSWDGSYNAVNVYVSNYYGYYNSVDYETYYGGTGTAKYMLVNDIVQTYGNSQSYYFKVEPLNDASSAGTAISNITAGVYYYKFDAGDTQSSSDMSAVPVPNNTFTSNSLTVTNMGTTRNGTYTASASSSYNTDFYPYKAFINGSSSTERWASSNSTYSSGTYNSSNTTTINTGSTIAGEWLQIQLPYSLILKKYEFKGYGDSSVPKNFYILGSNTGSSDWSIIDTQTNNAISSTIITFSSFVNNSAYKYYRFVSNTINGGTLVAIQRFNLFGTITTTQLLFNYSDFSSNTIITQTSAISSTTSKYGGASFYPYISSTSMASLTLPSNTLTSAGLTFATWVYMGTVSTGNSIRWFDFAVSDTYNLMGRLVYNGGLQIAYYVDNNTASSPNASYIATSYTTGTWAHVAIVHSGTTVYMYYNGSLASTTTSVSYPTIITRTSNKMGISNSGTGYSSQYIFLDDFVCYNHAFNATQISSLYNGRLQSGYSGTLVPLNKLSNGDFAATDVSAATAVSSLSSWTLSSSTDGSAAGRLLQPTQHTGTYAGKVIYSTDCTTLADWTVGLNVSVSNETFFMENIDYFYGDNYYVVNSGYYAYINIGQSFLNKTVKYDYFADNSGCPSVILAADLSGSGNPLRLESRTEYRNGFWMPVASTWKRHRSWQYPLYPMQFSLKTWYTVYAKITNYSLCYASMYEKSTGKLVGSHTFKINNCGTYLGITPGGGGGPHYIDNISIYENTDLPVKYKQSTVSYSASTSNTATLTQSVYLKATSYKLQFYASGRFGKMTGYYGSNTIFSDVETGGDGWKLYSYTFTPSIAGTYDLALYNTYYTSGDLSYSSVVASGNYYTAVYSGYINYVFYSTDTSTTNTLTITLPTGGTLPLKVLAVGGGGSGGKNGGGGGGGGVFQSGLVLTQSDILTISVGAGGIPDGGSGSTTTITFTNSSFNSSNVISAGGGGYGGYIGYNSRYGGSGTSITTGFSSGGSGGGGGRDTGTSGGSAGSGSGVTIYNTLYSTTTTYSDYMNIETICTTAAGTAGGYTTYTSGYGGGGGGGGAYSAGSNGGGTGTAATEYAGDGGEGIQCTIGGIDPTYYWGGGGGGAVDAANGNYLKSGKGGLGGGGGGNYGSGGSCGGSGIYYTVTNGYTGASSQSGRGAGGANTGGGGGTSLNGGERGGSGIVIIAVPMYALDMTGFKLYQVPQSSSTYYNYQLSINSYSDASFGSTYTYYVFKSTSATYTLDMTFNNTTKMHIFAVGGGGAGGMSYGGGGSGGAVVKKTLTYYNGFSEKMTIAVGAGGTATSSSSSSGSASTITFSNYSSYNISATGGTKGSTGTGGGLSLTNDTYTTTAHRYMKIVFTATKGSSSYIQFSELYFYSPGNVRYTPTSYKTNSTVSSGYGVDKAFDGNTSTYFSGTFSNPTYIIMDFGTTITPNRFGFTTSPNNEDYDPKSWKIYFSNDADSYTYNTGWVDISYGQTNYTATSSRSTFCGTWYPTYAISGVTTYEYTKWGNNGAVGYTHPTYSAIQGGGGGGSSTAGTAATGSTTAGGDGGDGLRPIDIDVDAIKDYSPYNTYYWAGGGGGAGPWGLYKAGNGGKGGGGSGGTDAYPNSWNGTSGIPGTAGTGGINDGGVGGASSTYGAGDGGENTGSGGGGAGARYKAGSGGSGIIILAIQKYEIS